jgi:phosphatidate cytidylyltransferase
VEPEPEAAFRIRKMGKLAKKKTWTALVIIPPVVFLIVVGPPAALMALVLLATFFGLWEYFRLALPHAQKKEWVVGTVLGLILSFLMAQGDVKVLFPFFVLLLLLLSLLFMATSRTFTLTLSNLGITLFGILFIGFLLSHVSLVRNMANGRWWVLFLIVTVWAGDIFAYLVGSLFGTHKLYPKISPNKTYEGLAGAVLGSILVALAFSALFLPHLKKGVSVLLAIGIGVLGQVGDFTESMLKRSAQVKDSGSLIPGHGGMLDRMDSFLFSAPFLYYSLVYLLKEPL